ncbi:hypothetical protein D9M71_525600 [compost metagenome]
MYATLRGQIGAGHLGCAMSLHLRFNRAKGQVRDQIGKGEFHLGAPPADQHLGGAYGVEQLGIAFWWLCLARVQWLGCYISIIERHIDDQAGPSRGPVPYPWRA